MKCILEFDLDLFAMIMNDERDEPAQCFFDDLEIFLRDQDPHDLPTGIKFVSLDGMNKEQAVIAHKARYYKNAPEQPQEHFKTKSKPLDAVRVKKIAVSNLYEPWFSSMPDWLRVALDAKTVAPVWRDDELCWWNVWCGDRDGPEKALPNTYIVHNNGVLSVMTTNEIEADNA